MQPGSSGGGPLRARDKFDALAESAFDFSGPVALRKSYIVASTPRSGSALFCARLWRTGLLGAPAGYMGYPGGRLGGAMAKRLQSSSHADYLAKVLGCRTSRNGVFGVKAHFKEFQDTLDLIPQTLNLLSPTTFLYFERRNKLAQAVDMARAEQTVKSVVVRKPNAPPRYNRTLISKYLGSLERGRLGWMRWFESNAIKPRIVTLEDLIADESAVVRGIVEFLGVQDDEPERVRPLIEVEAPDDRISVEWATRFEREIRCGIRTKGA